MEEKKIYVFYDDDIDLKIKVGTLYSNFQRGKEIFSFEYSDNFLIAFFLIIFSISIFNHTKLDNI